ncbi:unnamed protein product [Lathyrus sativus]|nr:unnamed protein product [Lathyrus sativus]
MGQCHHRHAIVCDGVIMKSGFVLEPDVVLSSLETVLTILHAGGKFGGVNSGYSVSGGLHGVGLSVVNALSEVLEVTVWREGLEYAQTYSRRKPVTTLNYASTYQW